MIACPVCKMANPDARERCVRCSAKLRPTLGIPSAEDAANRAPERATAALGSVKRAWYAFAQWISELDPIPVGSRHRTPGVCVLIGFIPGAPQLYSRQPVKMALFALAITALYIVNAIRIFEPDSNWWILGTLLLVFFSMADGWMRCNELNGRFTIRRFVFAYWLGITTIFFSAITILHTFGHIVGLHFTKVTGNDLSPWFRSGDRVFVWTWAVQGGLLPERGDIVYYTPGLLEVEVPGDLSSNGFLVGPRRTFGVVTALPGDTVEWQNHSRPQVNGKPAPDSWMPLNPDGLPGNLRMTVPEKRIAVLMSTGYSEYQLGPFSSDGVPTPRKIEQQGGILRHYDRASLSRDDGSVLGVVLFRFNPPERRVIFGRGKGFPQGGRGTAIPRGEPVR